MQKKNATLGLIFLGLGAIMLLNNLDVIQLNVSIWHFWPVIFFIMGISFEMGYFNNRHQKNAGLLVPGGIFLTYGLIFTYCSIFGYSHMVYLWPMFIGGVGVGLFQLYCFGYKEKPLFWVSFGFMAFAATAMFLGLITMKGNFVLPLVLILIGFLMLKNGKKPRVHYSRDDYRDEDEYE